MFLKRWIANIIIDRDIAKVQKGLDEAYRQYAILAKLRNDIEKRKDWMANEKDMKTFNTIISELDEAKRIIDSNIVRCKQQIEIYKGFKVLNQDFGKLSRDQINEAMAKFDLGPNAVKDKA